MDKAFWHQRWQEGRIGFHQDEVHPALPEYWDYAPHGASGVVFVPLCGKSNDMVWLAKQGWQVVGVELSAVAIEDFFAAQGLVPERSEINESLALYEAGAYRLYCGDLFHLHRDQLAEVCAVYDRASLVALPEPMRHRYAFHLAQMLSPGVSMLLISLEHEKPKGPPFSVEQEEIQWLFGANFELSLQDRLPEDDRNVVDVVYRMRRKGRHNAPRVASKLPA